MLLFLKIKMRIFLIYFYIKEKEVNNNNKFLLKYSSRIDLNVSISLLYNYFTSISLHKLKKLMICV